MKTVLLYSQSEPFQASWTLVPVLLNIDITCMCLQAILLTSLHSICYKWKKEKPIMLHLTHGQFSDLKEKVWQPCFV